MWRGQRPAEKYAMVLLLDETEGLVKGVRAGAKVGANVGAIVGARV